MGRPSLAQERTLEILDAFARCVARQGLDGTSLQDVADEAGMKRPILRHYIGNRSDLVTALATHVATRYRDRLDALVASLPARDQLDACLRYLISPNPAESADEILVLESLIAASAEDLTIREPMLAFVEHALDTFRSLIATSAPTTSTARCQATAYGLVSIWFNYASLTPLHPPAAHRRAALAACRALVRTL